jgi:predicted Zn-dependent peptidase
MDYQKTVLDNGLTIVTEKIATVHSISVGVWVKTGSRHENAGEMGMAHFLEHMMFKGTAKRTPLRIAQSLEELGGSLNAYTTKELTCYYASALNIHLKQTIEILADMVCNSVFHEKEVKREKSVVLEEINSAMDTPEDYIFDLFNDYLFEGHALGHPILGTAERINAITRDEVVDFWARHYRPDNMVIAATGNLEHEKVITLVKRYFSFCDTRQSRQVDSSPAIHWNNKRGRFHLQQDVNQLHYIVGCEGFSRYSPQRFALSLLNTYLGGGMSSRLFQNLRERKGLAYSVFSFIDLFDDTGAFGVYIGTDPRNLQKAQKMIQDELDRMAQRKLTAGVLKKIKNQTKGHVVLSSESTSRRMFKIANDEIFFQKQFSIAEIMQLTDAVTADEILAVAQQLNQPEAFLQISLGPQN